MDQVPQGARGEWLSPPPPNSFPLLPFPGVGLTPDRRPLAFGWVLPSHLWDSPTLGNNKYDLVCYLPGPSLCWESEAGPSEVWGNDLCAPQLARPLLLLCCPQSPQPTVFPVLTAPSSLSQCQIFL